VVRRQGAELSTTSRGDTSYFDERKEFIVNDVRQQNRHDKQTQSRLKAATLCPFV
jgi:hypothetical protein